MTAVVLGKALDNDFLRYCLRGWQAARPEGLQTWPQCPRGNSRQAAVLVPFCMQRGEPPRILLIRRAAHLKRHGGQMGFPGGVFEQGDGSLEHTAVRETVEETGIKAADIEPLGKLGELPTSSGFCLHVYIGWICEGYTLDPDPAEVAAVYFADAEQYLRPEAFRWRERVTSLGHRRMPELQLEDRCVWGVTGLIMWQLMRLLLSRGRNHETHQ